MPSTLTIEANTVNLNVLSLNDNNNIHYTEHKTNSSTTQSYLIFNGNKRRRISIECYTTYSDFEILKTATENYTKIYPVIYTPKNLNNIVSSNCYYYITKLVRNYKSSDKGYINYTIELIFGGGEEQEVFLLVTSDGNYFITSDNNNFAVVI
jgi:hypothetical protein